ncbi:GNAT family N-acetyltransferase [Ideonella sp. DXS29W]|uniref:GNAT family N-acetyltransferase n=1 Tax=Ideonella lacteola TaxID=2984193 RepID=A0ABU9BIJ0_9BURK
MTPHPLDRPVWASLSTLHQGLSFGGSEARRFDREVNVFASTRDEGAESYRALRELMAPGERVYVLQVPEIVVPAGLEVVKRARGVQMLAERSLGSEADAVMDGVADLCADDAAQMLALAQLTEPGPFLAGTHRMGSFVGVRDVSGRAPASPGMGAAGPRLLAMAGERLRLPGYTEVSGVCTHPDARGRGWARRLSTIVAARIQARGDQPFLHAWTTNHTAIALYQSLGFVTRAEVNVAVLEKPTP